ncbi:MAG: hypothetical protein ACSHX0_00760 [Akkermansiaceae bacterium]
MKIHPSLTLGLTACALVSCGSIGQPFEPSDGFNPLDIAGQSAVAASSDSNTDGYEQGAFLVTTSPNTILFSKFPSNASDQPSLILAEYTDVKVISTKSSYTKIEVVDTGEVGFVPTIMLGEKRSENEIPVIPGAEYLPTDEQIPSLLPDGVEPYSTEYQDPALELAVPFSQPLTEPSLDSSDLYPADDVPPVETVNPLLPAE